MNVDLKDEDLKKLVSEAILIGLDSAKRDLLIQTAIEHLLTPVKDYTGKLVSPLQELWNNQVSQISRKLIEEELENNTKLRTEIRGLFTEAFESLMLQKSELVKRMSKGLEEAITLERRY